MAANENKKGELFSSPFRFCADAQEIKKLAKAQK